MSKKILTLLLALFWCFTLSAQDFTEVSPTLQQVKPNPVLEATWDVQFDYDATAITGAAGNAGAVYIPTIGKFWTSKWASAVADQWNSDGTLDVTFNLPFTGTRGMCFDGQYVYCSNATTTVNIVDPVTKLVVGTVPVVGAPNGFRSITYNPDGDGGAGSIIGGNWTSPNLNFYEFSLTGTLLRTITNAVTGVYGLAYDNYSPGGPFLWVWGQGAGAGTPQIIQQMDWTTGNYTGITHDVTTDVGLGNASAIAGGMFITDQLVPGYVTLGGMLQGVPDELFGYELTPANTTYMFTDNFDSYTAGVQLACQNPVDWTTWSNLPCDPVEDAYVSNNFAYSGANSTVIVQNNDLVKTLDNQTTGKWYMSFVFYIPAGKSGYFNQLTAFTPDPYEWGMDSYFDVGGTGRVDTTGGGGATFIVPFTWVVGAWNQVIVIVDLDAPGHPAEYWIGQSPSTMTMVTTWDWTQAGTKATRIAANDFFGAAATDEMYFDNYYFGDAMPPIIPVELTSFTAISNNGIVELNWETATEINNHGFEIQRRTESSEYRTIGFVEGNGTTTETRNYSFVDKSVDQGINYYRLKQVDFDGTYFYSYEVEVDVTAPLTFDLAQNYPNPFNPSTNIQFSVPESGNVKLSVYNLVGEEVAVLVNGFRQAGTFEVTFDASNLSTGIYLYKLQSANSVQTKKMMLLK
jgi:hypothetical protein